MILSTERLRISTVTSNDIDEIHKLHSYPEVDEFNTMGIPQTMGETLSRVFLWLVQQDSKPRMNYNFTISLKDSGTFVGLIGFNLGKVNYKNAEIWYKILPEYWNLGYITEAVKAILNFGFNDLNLHRIEAGCATGNIGSIRVLVKAGMKKEGLHREILPIRGQWVDNYTFAILESDVRQL